MIFGNESTILSREAYLTKGGKIFTYYNPEWIVMRIPTVDQWIISIYD